MNNDMIYQFIELFKNGNSIRYSDLKKENNKLLRYIEKNGGVATWCEEYLNISREELVKSYGFGKQILPKLTIDEVIDRLNHLKSIGKLTTLAMRTEFDDLRLENYLKKNYGSVKKALLKLGYSKDSRLVDYNELVNEIKSLNEQGYDLSYKNMIINKSKIIHTITAKLNLSWYDTLTHIGVDFEPLKVVKYSKSMISEKLKSILNEHGTISHHILRNKYSGILMYVRDNYEGLEDFYLDFGYNPSDFMDLDSQRSMGFSFEKVFKEILDELNINYKYNKVIYGAKIRPDFLLDNGEIIDCKLSSWTSTIESTINKYKDNCDKLTIVYLRGSSKTTSKLVKELIDSDDKLSIISVNHYLDKLNEVSRQYFVDKLSNILKDEINPNDYTPCSLSN